MERVGFRVPGRCGAKRRGIGEAVVEWREGSLGYVKSGKQGVGEKGIHGIFLSPL